MNHDPHGCDELRAWSRRRFLQGAAGLGALGATPGVLPRFVRNLAGSGQRDTLVYIFLRGGIDGLSTVVPYTDGDYYAARPTLAVAAPGQTDGCLDLDGFFGLNPNAAPLMPAWSDGRLAFVHASGSTDPTRSHFEAFRKMELGVPNQSLFSVSEGWMARHLIETPSLAGGSLRCATIQDIMPLSLAGAPQTLPIPDFGAYELPGDPATLTDRKATLGLMYGSEAAPVGPSALDALGTFELLDGFDLGGYVPANGAVYPDTDFGQAIRQTAAVIKADLGVEVLMVELNGFDHHNEQGPIQGRLADLLDEVSKSLAALYDDLGTAMDRTLVVAHSEFGRRVAENGSDGTDHGHGGVMMLMGSTVQGGQVHGSWPGLSAGALDQGDLAVTTDYRDVLGEVLTKRLDCPNLGAVFPNHTLSVPGVLA